MCQNVYKYRGRINMNKIIPISISIAISLASSVVFAGGPNIITERGEVVIKPKPRPLPAPAPAPKTNSSSETLNLLEKFERLEKLEREAEEKRLRKEAATRDAVEMVEEVKENPSFITSSSRARHTAWAGIRSARDMNSPDVEGTIVDGFGGNSYINYSFVKYDISPIIGINFGDSKGFNLALGYKATGWFKPYVGASSFSDESFTSTEADIHAMVGSQFVIPVMSYEIGVDLGVTISGLDTLEVNSDSAIIPYIGAGISW